MATARKARKVTKKATNPAPKKRAVQSKAAPKARVSNNGKSAPAAEKSNGKLAKPAVSGKEQLQKERAQVESELATLRAELLEAPDMTGDEVDLNVYEREKTLGLVTAYERRLEEIDAALRAAARGTYGVCERCGTAIDPERLQIFPETRLCVNCKAEAEREARRLRM
jgi:RNA polymerase-binding protein DksA